ncbi:traB domain-containing protein [Anopheles nili]|uniref:traB domain-containing protein n=1 Tax=Anopheles nili TaxID=185578 RepID=UPI00237B531F|nr:traB domain-containing protein [Anopheles nili]
MSSPISSSSEYNSALDQTFNSTLGSDQLNLSDMSSSDIENVNLAGDWNETLLGKQKQKNVKKATHQLLDSLRNNNMDQPGETVGDASTLNSTASTLSLDLSAAGELSDTMNNITLSYVSSSEEDALTASTPRAPDVSVNMSLSETSTTNSQEEKDSRDTTANVSQLPAESGSDSAIPLYATLEEFDRNLPETVTLLTKPDGTKVYLVGTAHFSESSQRDVALVMRNVRPQVVMLELCPSRVHILKYDEKTLLEEAKDMNLAKMRAIIRTNGTINGLFYVLLLNMNAKFTKKLGMAPGGEFRCAVKEAQQIPNCVIQLGDRQIKVTLHRALRGLSLWQTIKLIPKLLFMDDDISVEEVEQCKRKDLLEEIMLEMADEFPAFGRVFIDERDLYLCHSLQMAALPQINRLDGSLEPVNVVGVVGIGHAAGIAKHWGKVDASSIESIVTIPPASLGHRVLKYTFKYGLLGLAAYGVFRFARPRLSRLLL